MKYNLDFYCANCKEVYSMDFIEKHKPLYCLKCGHKFLAFRKHEKDLETQTDKKAERVCAAVGAVGLPRPRRTLGICRCLT